MSGEPRLVECSVTSISYLRGDLVLNRTINMANVVSIERSKLAWYPDNTGKPALSFRFDHHVVQWAFNTEAEREAEYQAILAKFP